MATKIRGSPKDTAASKRFMGGLRLEMKKMVPLALMYLWILYCYTILRDTKVSWVKEYPDKAGRFCFFCWRMSPLLFLNFAATKMYAHIWVLC